MWVTRSSLSAESQAADLASHYAEAPDFEQVKSNDEVPEETYFAQCVWRHGTECTKLYKAGFETLRQNIQLCKDKPHV